MIDGVECEHLAFRGVDTDWQIWVRERRASDPAKNTVITSKTLAAAPQYSLRIKEWKTDVPAEADTYVFKPPADAKKVDLDAFGHDGV